MRHNGRIDDLTARVIADFQVWNGVDDQTRWARDTAGQQRWEDHGNDGGRHVGPSTGRAMSDLDTRARQETGRETAELLKRCAQGDVAAWDQVVNDYQRLVYAIAVREGLDESDASDVTQEVFGALLASLNTIREPERLASWLMTVARRATWRRRVDRAVGTPLDPRLDAPADCVTDPDEFVARAIWVHDAVAALGEPCTSLLRTLFFDPDEPSYAEAAAQLELPIGSIGPTRSRCLGRLRRELDRGDSDV